MREAFIKLIKKYGFNDELHTFEYECELANSTIDKISICGHDILFYYNENTGDCDEYGDFKEQDLADFYFHLRNKLEEEDETKENWVGERIEMALQHIFAYDYVNMIEEDIIGDVMEDIHECADADFNGDDIDLAIQRVLMKKMGYSV